MTHAVCRLNLSPSMCSRPWPGCNGKIAFEQRPLGEVADEFNRYGSIPIEIDDAALRALPISGVFDAYDIDSFVAFLQTLDGVRVERTNARIRVFSVKSQKE